MKNNKKLWIPIVAVVLAVVIGVGVLIVSRLPGQEVAVFPVSMVGYTDYYSGSSESYGLVTTDKVQTHYLSDTQTVTEILVYQGQEVKKGDVLFTYDTTLSDLALERKDLSIQQMEASLKNAQAELKVINQLKPMQIVAGTSESDEKDDSDYSKSPSDSAKLNTEYSDGNPGRSRLQPFYFWLKYGDTITDEMIGELFAKAESISEDQFDTIFVVFQSVKNNKTNTEFTESHNLCITRTTETITITVPDTGTQSQQISAEPAAVASGLVLMTDPAEEEQPGEETPDPGEEDPGEETPDPSEETTEPTDPPVTEPPVTEPPVTEPQPQTVTTQVTRYSMSFFSLTGSSDTTDSNGSVSINSGYTKSEIAAMKSEKNAQIKQLQFDIKMAKAELKIMEKEADSGQVTADFDGVVASIIEPAQAMETGEPMIKVSGGGGYYVEGTVSELELDTITIGQSVTVTSWDTGGIYTGTVTEVGSYPSEEQSYYGSSNVSYYPYKVFIDESADLMEGFYVSMTYQTEAQAAGTLYLQNAFLRKDGNRVYVYVRNDEGLLEKRYLEAGVSTDGYMTPIYDGITEEDYLAFPYGKDTVDGAPTYEGTDQDLYGY